MMKLRTVVVSFCVYIGLPAYAEEPATVVDEAPAPTEGRTAVPADPAVKPVGFVDANRDGINDRFFDADGNGTNDVDGTQYPHHFRSADSDGDGVNDLFVDSDGDGVNDLDASFTDSDKDGFCDNVIDEDGDGVNDITGGKYDRDSLEGFRHGRVDEESKVTHGVFVDEDGDGMHDRPGMELMRGEQLDRFVDEDGDGICDGRQITGRKTIGHGEAGEHGRRGRHGRGSSKAGGMGMPKE